VGLVGPGLNRKKSKKKGKVVMLKKIGKVMQGVYHSCGLAGRRLWALAVGLGAVALHLVARGQVALAAFLVMAWAAVNARAQFTPVFGDPSTITAAATTAFTAIATFMIGVLGFWVIFRLVRKIRGS
jgi:hypothetical protein